MATTTIQDIFEMRKNGQFEQAYENILPLYREHHGHYTTLCMFWTATDVMRIRMDNGKCAEAEQLFAAIRQLYPNLQDRNLIAARTLNRLALQLATKEQELRKQPVVKEEMQFSLLDYMVDFGIHYLTEEDWQLSEYNGHLVPSFGMKIISRIFHEVSKPESSEKRLQDALDMVQMGLQHTPRNRHMLRYQAQLLFRCGAKQKAIELYRQLLSNGRESYLYSELASMIEDKQEQVALLSKAIVNQHMEVFAQKDRLTMAQLLKEYYPQHAAYELQQVVQLRDSLGQHMNRAILGLQKDLADITPVSHSAQVSFYKQLQSSSRQTA